MVNYFVFTLPCNIPISHAANNKFLSSYPLPHLHHHTRRAMCRASHALSHSLAQSELFSTFSGPLTMCGKARIRYTNNSTYSD